MIVASRHAQARKGELIISKQSSVLNNSGAVKHQKGENTTKLTGSLSLSFSVELEIFSEFMRFWKKNISNIKNDLFTEEEKREKKIVKRSSTRVCFAFL